MENPDEIINTGEEGQVGEVTGRTGQGNPPPSAMHPHPPPTLPENPTYNPNKPVEVTVKTQADEHTMPSAPPIEEGEGKSNRSQEEGFFVTISQLKEWGLLNRKPFGKTRVSRPVTPEINSTRARPITPLIYQTGHGTRPQSKPSGKTFSPPSPKQHKPSMPYDFSEDESSSSEGSSSNSSSAGDFTKVADDIEKEKAQMREMEHFAAREGGHSAYPSRKPFGKKEKDDRKKRLSEEKWRTTMMAATGGGRPGGSRFVQNTRDNPQKWLEKCGKAYGTWVDDADPEWKKKVGYENFLSAPSKAVAREITKGLREHSETLHELSGDIRTYRLRLTYKEIDWTSQHVPLAEQILADFLSKADERFGLKQRNDIQRRLVDYTIGLLMDEDKAINEDWEDHRQQVVITKYLQNKKAHGKLVAHKPYRISVKRKKCINAMLKVMKARKVMLEDHQLINEEARQEKIRTDRLSLYEAGALDQYKEHILTDPPRFGDIDVLQSDTAKRLQANVLWNTQQNLLFHGRQNEHPELVQNYLKQARRLIEGIYTPETAIDIMKALCPRTGRVHTSWRNASHSIFQYRADPVAKFHEVWYKIQTWSDVEHDRDDTERKILKVVFSAPGGNRFKDLRVWVEDLVDLVTIFHKDKKNSLETERNMEIDTMNDLCHLKLALFFDNIYTLVSHQFENHKKAMGLTYRSAEDYAAYFSTFVHMSKTRATATKTPHFYQNNVWMSRAETHWKNSNKEVRIRRFSGAGKQNACQGDAGDVGDIYNFPEEEDFNIGGERGGDDSRSHHMAAYNMDVRTHNNPAKRTTDKIGNPNSKKPSRRSRPTRPTPIYGTFGPDEEFCWQCALSPTHKSPRCELYGFNSPMVPNEEACKWCGLLHSGTCRHPIGSKKMRMFCIAQSNPSLNQEEVETKLRQLEDFGDYEDSNDDTASDCKGDLGGLTLNDADDDDEGGFVGDHFGRHQNIDK